MPIWWNGIHASFRNWVLRAGSTPTSVLGGIMSDSDRRAAEFMAIHIQGFLSSLRPDDQGNFKSLSSEEVEELYLFTKIFLHEKTVKEVFERLRNG